MNEPRMSPKVFGLGRKRVFLTGHRGMVGAALARQLGNSNCELITAGHEQLDLLRQEDTERFLLANKPEVVIVAAGKVAAFMQTTASRPNSFTTTSRSPRT